MSSFNEYSLLCKENRIKKPLLILIGGYSGSGKSTLAKRIVEVVPNLNIIPTGFVRAACKPFIKNEYSGVHTFDLNTVAIKLNLPAESLLLAQGRTLYPAIASMAGFLETEKQSAIFEGNHIFPDLEDELTSYNPITVFMKCTDNNKLIENMCGPTHPRTLSEVQKQTAILLNKFYMKHVQDLGRNMFEYNDTDNAVSFIEQELGKRIDFLSK
ncbi:hypothetical protein COV87_02730 [Candidatus Roizmanbacteria bacterium CG11_big_fil_rev_8_21_14_0_20_37_16]|uniref:Uncharacterized protein n=1 Tax=Candidatus Roizmanbacteria bacterium CG11_big_fil_rev_8_21_14_0_20_37_16 TaxID=1974857 RepID=A0A2H0KJX4_9BACT|nr:MAG: hypothetical protein COV87_02730 [Candidatus Roizmanbacteria bacterium CG11_big_fil_rev_8_21_14_0_20_37_16]